jgi:DNA-directed RNA polymerase subunit alpha
MEHNIILPSKPKVVKEEASQGIYEIDSLYPGYGHTLGNSLRRIILSSLPGTAITSLSIEGVSHEFASIEGVKEDVVTILLNLKKVHFQLLSDEPQEVTMEIKGQHKITASDLKLPGQVQVINKNQYIAEITGKNTSLNIKLRIERGLGYVPKEVLQKEKVEVGAIALDAVFTPIRRVNYEVENMRVGDRTDYNKLRIFVETDGTVTPREVLERAISIMIQQLQAIVGFQKEPEEEKLENARDKEVDGQVVDEEDEGPEDNHKEFLKTRVDSLGFSTRTANALAKANVRTIGGLARKNEEELLHLDGLGSKGIQEIKRTLSNFGITLK